MPARGRAAEGRRTCRTTAASSPARETAGPLRSRPDCQTMHRRGTTAGRRIRRSHRRILDAGLARQSAEASRKSCFRSSRPRCRTARDDASHFPRHHKSRPQRTRDRQLLPRSRTGHPRTGPEGSRPERPPMARTDPTAKQPPRPPPPGPTWLLELHHPLLTADVAGGVLATTTTAAATTAERTPRTT